MPYMIVRRGDMYYVHKRGADGRPEGLRLGRHATRAEAQAQISALYAAEGAPPRRSAGRRAKTLSLNELRAAAPPDFPTKYPVGARVRVRPANEFGEVIAVNRTRAGVVYTVQLGSGGLAVCRARDLERAAAARGIKDDAVRRLILDAAARAVERRSAGSDSPTDPLPNGLADETADETADEARDGSANGSASSDTLEDDRRRALIKALDWAIAHDDSQTAAALASLIVPTSQAQESALAYLTAATSGLASDWSKAAHDWYQFAFAPTERADALVDESTP